MNQLLINSKRRLGEIALLSTIYHEARLRRLKTLQDSPILVHQMGKVGSRSIVDSLKAMKLDQPIYHTHFLNENSLENAGRMLHNFYGRHYNVNRWCLYESRFVVKHFLQLNNRKLKIISLVREPIARNISSFFYNIDMFIPNCKALYEEGQIHIREITQHFLEKFHEHRLPLTWFDDEIKSVFGIDVFSASACSPKDGVFVYRHGNWDLLIMKTEAINIVAQDALRHFLQLRYFDLKRSNDSSDKQYSQMYDDFVKSADLPEDYLTTMYESKYSRHFYSSSEIERFKARWSRR
jgi:hypothetical protein